MYYMIFIFLSILLNCIAVSWATDLPIEIAKCQVTSYNIVDYITKLHKML
jgi:hypothetical protein